jgi:hypothetical protein
MMIMKKYISLAMMTIAFSFGFVACSVETDEEPGGTNVQNMAGRWVVSVAQVDEAGNVVFEPEDLFEAIDIDLFTYNTADNASTEMWIDDRGNFWAFKFKVPINYANGTFSATAIPYDANNQAIADAIAAGETPVDEDGNPLVAETATITDGKILYGQGHNIHGMPTDSIAFYVTFTDDSYGARYGYAKHLVTGTRYSGFYE